MRLLFYPNGRVGGTRLNLGLQRMPEIEKGTKESFDVGVYWNFTDVNEPDEFVAECVDKGIRFINHRLNNVSKKAVDEYMTSAFGYSSLVDEGYSGRCITKRNKQSRGAVSEIDYPKGRTSNEGLDKYDEDYRIHQKIIDTAISGNCIEYRLFIFFPYTFVLVKTKSVKKRYHSNAEHYLYRNIGDVFDQEEVEMLINFCSASGLELGEIDVLKDITTGLIYVVDINNISGGATFFLNFKDDDGVPVIDHYVSKLRKMLNR